MKDADGEGSLFYVPMRLLSSFVSIDRRSLATFFEGCR